MSMFEYLIREIESAPNIVVRFGVAVTGGAGQSHLEGLTLTDLESGAAETVDAAALFVLIGAEPRTHWPPDAVRRDQSGFVVTGTDLLQGGRLSSGHCGACRCSWNPACPGSSRSATSGTGRSNASPRPSEGSIAIHLVHDHLRGD